jgi:hypothetical protein
MRSVLLVEYIMKKSQECYFHTIAQYYFGIFVRYSGKIRGTTGLEKLT